MNGCRTVLALLAGIVILVSAHLLWDVNTQEPPKTLRRHVLERAAEKMTVCTVARAGQPPVVLKKDGDWEVVSPYVAVADPQAVLRLSDALAFFPILDEMSDAELLRLGRTRADFGLAKPRLVVSFSGAADDKPVSVAFGSTTPAGDGVYATVGHADAVYVVQTNVLTAVDLDVMAFRRRQLFGASAEHISAIDIKSEAGRTVRLAREGTSWRITSPRESVASTTLVNAFLADIVGLEALSFVWSVCATNETAVPSASLLAGYGLDAETAVTVTLRDADGTSEAISLGSNADASSVYALAPDGRTVVTVPVSVRAAVRADAESFLDLRLFPLAASDVHAISINDDGVVHLLARTPEGGWRMDAPVSAPADAAAVDALVARLLKMKSSDVAADGVVVSLGTNATPVAVSRQALLADARLADLRTKSLVDVNPSLVRRVVATDGDGASVAVVFDGEKGVWNTESSKGGLRVDATAIALLLKTLHPLDALRVVRLKVSPAELGAFGLDKPVRMVAIDQTTEGSVRRNVLIGANTDGGCYATVGASDAVFVLSSEVAAALLAPLAK